ncbi:Calcium-binding EF hand family protein [Perilla frutescens var. hirtella]|nr:Calcium-binding EF hand family protein [Perilla frutescens var. hirtella]KAH6815350.1 Calcium-binding EF hand family protein [Perilla frutescens var. frutescens]
MGIASVIIYITVALALLLLISRSSHLTKPHGRRIRRLKIRSNFTFPPPADLRRHHYDRPAAFDPLVADIELHREDRQWEHLYFQKHHPESTQPAPGHESQPEWEDFADAEDYLNDEERFNVTNRLVLLFPRIDIDPPDGFVSEPELTQWNLLQSQREALHRSQREMETHDKNKDGFVSFAEYEAPSWVRNADNTSFGYDIGWWKEDHFNASDVDGDGRLNITEFNDFLHPADTINPKLLLWLCNEEIRERDGDKDGKVNFNEFFHGLFDLVRDYEETANSSDESNDSLEAPAKVLFTQLDKDGDGYLSAVELLPIIGKLHPSEHHYASQQTDYILQQADADKDGRLTLSEMIESPYVFYTAVFNEGEESDYELHDEFR